jgi:hypothetical protein
MGQVTIYLDDEVEAKMRDAAKAMNLSQSKWISNIIQRQIADTWPESVKKLAGAWQDFPTINEIRRVIGKDIDREKI